MANVAANINGFSTRDSSGKCYFRPALFWQVVREYHIVDAGLEFRMNFESKVNEARFPSSLDLESQPSQLAVAKARALSIVSEKEGRDDSRLLSTMLRNFCTWGKEDEVLKLEIDPKSHSAWTGGKQKLMDKGRISKFNKKFQNFRSEKKD